MVAYESGFDKIQELLEAIVALVDECAEKGERVDLVERKLFDQLLVLGCRMLQRFFESAGDGDVGETLEREGELLQRIDMRKRVYRSVFGVLEFQRMVYAVRKGQKSYSPVDEALSLPADEQSYVLEDWLQRFCVQNSFDSSVQSLRELLGIKVGKRSAERINKKLGEASESFRQSCRNAPVDNEEELIVVTADGKGVPMRHTLEERMGLPEPAWRKCRRKQLEKQNQDRAKKRLGPGHGKTHKQMAFIGAVYTIAPWSRTTEEITNDLLRKESATNRPTPQNKHLFAEMTHYREGERWDGQPQLFRDLRNEILLRDPQCGKTLICVMDGQRSLWDYQRQYLKRAVCIVDVFHVIEYLWDAAYCFHEKHSRAAEKMVEHYLPMLIEGRVSYIIGSLHRKRSKLKGTAKPKQLDRVLKYLRNNKQHMKYDEYLREGYPIGSGVVEGACRHLVRDRMERTGMKWEIEGARAMLNTRSVYVNKDWNEMIEHYIRKEQHRLYGQAA